MTEGMQLKDFLLELDLAGLPRSWFDDERSLKSQGSTSVAPIENDSRAKLGYSELYQQAISCRLCSLCETRQSVVFGSGNTNSPLIAFVGESFFADEDAAQLLKSAIEKGLGLRPEDVYQCNVIKCSLPWNKKPLPNEVLSCSPYLYRQLELVNPKVIVTLGDTAQLVLSGSQVGISELRGQWQKWRDIPLMPTYHTSYILSNPGAKKPFWQDLQSVMKFLGI